MRCGMLERLQSGVHLAKQAAQVAKQLRGVRAHFGKKGSFQKAQQPNQPLRAIRSNRFREELAVAIRQHARQGELRRARGEMHQRLRLQVDERGLARRMHHLQDEGAARRCNQMKILVVFAGKRPRRCLQPIHFARQPGGLGFRQTMGDACFKRHASNFICKGATASTAPQESSDSSLASGEPRPNVSRALLQPTPAHSP